MITRFVMDGCKNQSKHTGGSYIERAFRPVANCIPPFVKSLSAPRVAMGATARRRYVHALLQHPS